MRAEDDGNGDRFPVLSVNKTVLVYVTNANDAPVLPVDASISGGGEDEEDAIRGPDLLNLLEARC